MAWPERWKALSARIEGITRSGEYIVAALQRNDGDSFGIVRQWVAPELEKITNELRAFCQASQADLPTAAADALDRFFVQEWFTKQPELINANLVSIAAMATFRAEFEYLIHDTETEGRNRTEVAFEHLQRMIAVDEGVRQKWKNAYNRNEPACERLGAVHLLSHGIFAFKIMSGDSATDLVFNDPLDDRSQIIRRAARAIVLTEWKLASDASASNKATEARKQTLEYAHGVLGDTELKRTRYVVLVSEHQIAPVPDVESDGIKFRHVNIAVNPRTPSRAARVAPPREAASSRKSTSSNILQTGHKRSSAKSAKTP